MGGRKRKSRSSTPTDNSDMDEEEFIVEKVVDKRINPTTKTVEYFLKWKGYSSKHNTWEPEEHLECPELIKEYEDSIKKVDTEKPKEKNPPTKRRRLSSGSSISQKSSSKPEKSTKNEELNTSTSSTQSDINEVIKYSKGFEEGWVAQEIIGALETKGELAFLMKWKNISKAEMVRAKDANIHCPQVVIKFYESRIKWDSESKELID